MDPRLEQYLALHGLTPRVTTVMPLTGDASDRRYFRVLLKDEQPVVLALHQGSIEFERMPFVAIARLLRQIPVPVPAILHHSNELGVLGLEDLGTPAALVGIAQVHAQQVAREEGRFFATLPRLDLEDDVLAVEGVTRDEEFAQPLGNFLAARVEHVRFVGESGVDISELTRCRNVVTEGEPHPVRLDGRAQLSMATSQATRLGGIGMDCRISQALLDRGVLGGQLDAGVEHGTYLSAMSGDALQSKARHSDAEALSLPPKRFSHFATRPPESRIF